MFFVPIDVGVEFVLEVLHDFLPSKKTIESIKQFQNFSADVIEYIIHYYAGHGRMSCAKVG